MWEQSPIPFRPAAVGAGSAFYKGGRGLAALSSGPQRRRPSFEGSAEPRFDSLPERVWTVWHLEWVIEPRPRR